MIRPVLYCYICGWIPVNSSGHAMHPKSVPFPARNTAGSWKDFPLSSQRRCALRKRGISDYFCEKQRIEKFYSALEIPVKNGYPQTDTDHGGLSTPAFLFLEIHVDNIP